MVHWIRVLTSFRRPCLFIAFWVLGAVLPTLSLRLPSSGIFKLVIDAEIESGRVIAIFTNNDYSRSPSVPISPGVRTKYTFEDLHEPIRQLRIDPTDIPSSRFKIYSVSVLKNDVMIYELTGASLASAGLVNAAVDSEQADGIAYRATSNDPMMHTTLSYGVSRAERILQQIGGTAVERALNISALCLLLIFCIGFFRWREPEFFAFLPILLLPVIAYCAHYVASISLSYLRSPLPIGGSVGVSSYIGVPKAVETWTFLIIISVAALVGAGFGLMRSAQVISDPCRAGDQRFSLNFIAAICFFIALGSFPDLHKSFVGLSSASHAPDWDSQAILNWQYVANLGLLPYRDYWFPYGGFWNTLAPFPWDLLRLYVFKTIVYSMLSVCVYILTGNNKLWSSGILFAILSFDQANYFQGLYRYALSLDVVLFYLCLSISHTNRMGLYICFGIFSGFVFFYEPTQLFYAAFPVLTIFLLNLTRRDDPRSVFRQLRLHLVSSSVFLVVFVAFIAKLAYFKQLDGWLRFYSQLGAMAGSSATPAALTQWSELSLKPENVVFLGTLFLIMWGTYLVTSKRFGWDGKKAGYICLALGLLGGMIFLKHIVRPHMARQFIIVHFLGIVLFLSIYSSKWNKVQNALGATMFGALLAFAVNSGVVSHLQTRFTTTIGSLSANMATLLIDARAMQTQQNAFFAPHLFTEKSVAAKALYDFLSALKGKDQVPSLYVLGDEVYVYIMMGKTPPPYTSVYDGGAIQAQQVTLQWLEKNQPDLVVWNSDAQSFDGVPNMIRVPLLFEYVISNYSYKTEVGKFFIFERKPAAVAVDMAFWSSVLGSSVNLHHLAMASSYPRLPDCGTSAAEDCDDYLVLQVDQPQKQKARSIVVEVGMHRYTLNFYEIAQHTDYHINLSRLWFWSTAKKFGIERKIVSPSEVGEAWRLSSKVRDPEVLY